MSWTDAIADEGKLIEVRPHTGNYYELPAYGFIEAVEIRFVPPLPNMDASNPWRMVLELAGGHTGTKPPPFQMFLRVRNVKDSAA